MISSVIAKLDPTFADIAQTFEFISQRPGVEMGEVVDERSLPMTIESATSAETEETTRWLQELDGIEFVDVVFVHFEL